MAHEKPFSWRCALAAALGLALLLGMDIPVALAFEHVRFESARYIAGPLQIRLARERGETVERPVAQVIDGYLVKPAGDGPFPAVVVLHGCNGLSAATRDRWTGQVVAWGYAVLFVDSFRARGVKETCTSHTEPYRVADAFGAFAFLERQPFVDPHRIAVMGFSAGGIAVLSAVQQRDFELFEEPVGRTFKAAIALYPQCFHDGVMSTPTLILIGEVDDWSPSEACRKMMARRNGSGSAVRLVVYPGAYHDFDVPSFQPGRRSFGHWLQYNRAAAESAVKEVQRFLADTLAK
jgi:dienelactone hydrolase